MYGGAGVRGRHPLHGLHSRLVQRAAPRGGLRGASDRRVPTGRTASARSSRSPLERPSSARLGRDLHAQPCGRPRRHARVPATPAPRRLRGHRRQRPVDGRDAGRARAVAGPHPLLATTRSGTCRSPATSGSAPASGELIAFIDDDALPEPEWLTQAIPAFDDPEVAGAGGIVFDHTGMGLQYRYSRHGPAVSDRAGASTSSPVSASPGPSSSPTCRARTRSTVASRLIDGRRVRREHLLLRRRLRHLRASHRCRMGDPPTGDLAGAPQVPAVGDPRPPADHDELVPGRPRPHVLLRSATPRRTSPRTRSCTACTSSFTPRVADTQWHEEAGRLPPGSSIHAEATCMSAFAEGLRVGRDWIGVTAAEARRLDEVEFLRVPDAEPRTVGGSWCFVSSSYTGNLTGGVGQVLQRPRARRWRRVATTSG